MPGVGNVGAQPNSAPRSRVARINGRAARLRGKVISASFLPLLGVTPELGRTFLEREDREDVPVAILSHHLWRNELGGPSLDGLTLTLDGVPTTVVGVLSQDFAFEDEPIDFWMPIGTYRDLRGTTND